MILAPGIVAALLVIASFLSGYPIPPHAHPRVGFASNAYGEKLGRDDTMGITNLRDGRIFLYPGWQLDNRDACVAVHELTHYLQVVNHAVLEPSEANEPLAYIVTEKCYRMFGRPDLADWAHGKVLEMDELLTSRH